MKKIVTLITLTILTTSLTGQELDFAEISSIPEFNLFTVHNCELTECTIITSGVSNAIAISFGGGDYVLFENLSSQKPILFLEVTQNHVIGHSRSNLFAITPNNISELSFDLEPGEEITALLPGENNSFLVSTTLGLYSSTDLGITFQLIELWTEKTEHYFPLESLERTYSIKRFPDLGRFFLESREFNGDFITEFELFFFPRSMIIEDGIAYLTAFGENQVYSVDIFSGEILGTSFQELGNKNDLFVHLDSKLLFSTDNQRLYNFDSNSLTDITPIDFFSSTKPGLQSSRRFQ